MYNINTLNKESLEDLNCPSSYSNYNKKSENIRLNQINNKIRNIYKIFDK